MTQLVTATARPTVTDRPATAPPSVAAPSAPPAVTLGTSGRTARPAARRGHRRRPRRRFGHLPGTGGRRLPAGDPCSGDENLLVTGLPPDTDHQVLIEARNSAGAVRSASLAAHTWPGPQAKLIKVPYTDRPPPACPVPPRTRPGRPWNSAMPSPTPTTRCSSGTPTPRPNRFPPRSRNGSCTPTRPAPGCSRPEWTPTGNPAGRTGPRRLLRLRVLDLWAVVVGPGLESGIESNQFSPWGRDVVNPFAP